MAEWLDSLPPYLLPIMIFFARVIDVSIGTMRTILVTREKKGLAPILGFFEILLWTLTLGQVMSRLNSFITYVAFAGGFATGNFVGIFLESRIALGYVLVRIISHQEIAPLQEALKTRPEGMTNLEAQGKMGKVSILFTIIKRKDLSKILKLIETYTPEAFYSVEDVRALKVGDFPSVPSSSRKGFLDPLRSWRKGK